MATHKLCVVSSADSDAVVVIEVTIPSSPSRRGYITGNGPPNYLEGATFNVVVDPYVYNASSYDDAFVIVDITTLTAPSLKGELHGIGSPNYLQNAWGVAKYGNYVFVSAWNEGSVSVFDVTDPAAPSYVTRILVTNPRWICIDGDYLYIPSVNGVNSSLYIYDISTPGSPSLTGSITANNIYNPIQVIVDGNFAYIAQNGNLGYDGLIIIDITNKAAPSYKGSLFGRGAPNYLGNATCLAKSGNYVFVGTLTDDSLVVINVTDPAAPSLETVVRGAGSPYYLGQPSGMVINGNYLYIVCRVEDALVVYDISTPTSPSRVGLLKGSTYHLNGAHNLSYLELDSPTVTAQAVTDVLATTATGNGDVVDLGDRAVTQHGHCWSIAANPTISDSKTMNGVKAATGPFTSDIAGLSPGTTYHVRPYATNAVGTSYGGDLTFTTGHNVGSVGVGALELLT